MMPTNWRPCRRGHAQYRQLPARAEPTNRTSADGGDAEPTATTTAKRTEKKKPASSSAAGPRPYNRYNLYFILERESQVLARGGTTRWSAHRGAPSVPPGYENLQLAPLPPRFAHLTVPEGWCLSGQKEKRSHRKTHGVASFKDMARDIGKSWKEIDEVTLRWCTAVEKILRERHRELKRREAAEKLATAARAGAGAVTGALKNASGPTRRVSEPESLQSNAEEPSWPRPHERPAVARHPRRASAPEAFVPDDVDFKRDVLAYIEGVLLRADPVAEVDVPIDPWSEEVDSLLKETASRRGMAYVSDDEIRMWYME